MIFNIMACKVVNCHQKGICFGMEIREASHTPINPLHTTHKLYIPRSSILTKKQSAWALLSTSGSGLLVGENEVLAECSLGPISVPSSRRIIGTMLAQDNVRGFQRFYSTRNLIQFLERPRSPQGRKEQ